MLANRGRDHGARGARWYPVRDNRMRDQLRCRCTLGDAPAAVDVAMSVTTPAVVLSLLMACALPASACARAVLLGHSWQGRPIEAVEVGSTSGTPLLVVG